MLFSLGDGLRKGGYRRTTSGGGASRGPDRCPFSTKDEGAFSGVNARLLFGNEVIYYFVNSESLSLS